MLDASSRITGRPGTQPCAAQDRGHSSNTGRLGLQAIIFSGVAASQAGTAPSRGLLVPEAAAAAFGEAAGRPYRLRRDGLDAVDFLLAAAPAEPLRPLSAVASGGEAARVMLALKAAPAAAVAASLAPGARLLVCLTCTTATVGEPL